MKTISRSFSIVGDYLRIFLLLFFANSFSLSQFSGSFRLAMYLLLVISLVVSSFRIKGTIVFPRVSLVVFVGTICNISLTVFANNEEISQLMINTILFLTAFMFITYYDIEAFLKKFTNIMLFVCSYSLIIYFSALLVPNVITHLPVIYNPVGRPAYNAVISTITIDGYILRNQGFFWEPGAFQTFICIALVVIMFFTKEKKARNSVILYLTLFTTFSTTGYVVGMLILILFVLDFLTKTDRKNQRRVIRIGALVLVLLAIAYIVYERLPSTVKYQLFGKVMDYWKYGGYSSTSVRVDSFIVPFREFLISPLWGNGTIGMSEIARSAGYTMNTATAINWFAFFGVFVGLSMNYGIYSLCKVFGLRPLVRFLIFVALILSISSQDYVRNPSVLVFAFLGYSINKAKTTNYPLPVSPNTIISPLHKGIDL